MLFNQATIDLWGVYDKGLANRERIILRARQAVDLRYFGVGVGFQQPGQMNSVVPYRDQFFWFGSCNVMVNDWIFLYTCSGEYSKVFSEKKEPMHLFFWGKSKTLFASTSVVPFVFKMADIQVGSPPEDQPQQLLLEKR